MPKKKKLSKNMSLADFDRGYWYAEELKAFARELGVPSVTRLRKDEIEKAIKDFLRTGKARNPARRGLKREGPRDLDQGLRLSLPIRNYTSNRATKDFIEKEAAKIAPGLKKRSGARYRLNRWREEQLAAGKKITYGDLVREYVRLNTGTEPFAKIPSGRYINFLSDFLAREKNATHADARRAWAALKKMDVPKDYASWKKTKKK